MIKHLIIAAGAALALASTGVLAADQGTNTTAADSAAKSPDSKSSDTTASTSSAKTAAGDTRDWKQVDSNSDNLVSPEEMEKYLASTRDSSKKAATK